MEANIFLCLNEVTYNSNVPGVFDRFKKAKYDDDGNLEELLPATYAEIAEQNASDLGVALKITIDESNYYLIKWEASFLNGEVSELLNLGKGLSYPNNSVLTKQEAIELLEEFSPEE
jgi:hypothetical protein